MFRRGGSTGGGITSGLTRPGYHRGRVVNPGGYKGSPTELIWTDEEREQMMKALPARGKSSAGADFWLNFGTNILAQPGGRPILQTLGTAAKEPLAQLQKTKAYERMAPREEEVDLLKTFMTSKGDMMSDLSSDMFSKEQQSAAIGTYTDELFALSDQLEEGTLSKKDYDKKRIKIWNKMQPYIKNNPELEALWKVEGYADEAYREYKNTILMDESVYVDANGNPKIEDGQEVTVAEWFMRKENLPELRKRATDMYLKEAQDRRIGMLTGQAKGGRVGYAGGELVEQEDVNIQTPRGDISMQETVVEPDQLSYEELRSRLPVEITDDIVRLLVSSASALGDFAQIQTQVDVDNFNAKYGVNLVLPSEA
jgi:hypothetical protein